ncbi:MAG: Hsp20/alpha crystallin family protein [Gemmatimonadales bacterium]
MLYPLIRRRPSAARSSSVGLSDLDGLFNRFFEGGFTDEPGRWVPNVDIAEGEESLLLKADLPGVSAEDVSVTLENGYLTISGERKIESNEEHDTLHVVERFVGRFSRSFRLPETVDGDKIEGRFSDGVLELNLPKLAKAKPRKVNIKFGK